MARDNLISEITSDYLVATVKDELEAKMTIEKEYEEEAYETIKRLITLVNCWED